MPYRKTSNGYLVKVNAGQQFLLALFWFVFAALIFGAMIFAKTATFYGYLFGAVVGVFSVFVGWGCLEVWWGIIMAEGEAMTQNPREKR